MRKRHAEILLIMVGYLSLTVVISQPVVAYIDPGTGSYFVQIIVAGVASFTAFFVKPIVEKLKGLFKKNAPKPKEQSTDDIQR